MSSPSERLAKVNWLLNYVKNIPQNKWDYGKACEMHENNLKEALDRLAAHKFKVSEFESKHRLRGIDEAEVQKGVYTSYSHEHIQLLERIITAKKTLSMMRMDTVEELTRQKIAILEEIASCDAQ